MLRGFLWNLPSSFAARMKTPVRTAVESSLVAAVAAAGCLWLLVSAANAEDAKDRKSVV